jgi:GAF domain-containing protein
VNVANLDATIAGCARKLLGNLSMPRPVQEALIELGTAEGIHHAFLFQIESYHAEDLRGRWLGCSERSECPYCSDNREGDCLRLIDDSIRSELEQGHPIFLSTEELVPELRHAFLERGIHSILFLPLVVLGAWWGGLVIESRCPADQWPGRPTGDLETLTTLFSVYFERQVASEGYQERDKLSGALEMAGTVCHKLNQPMQVILGYSSMVTSGDIGEPEQIKEVVKLIEDETRQMGIITKNLMGITKNKCAA